LGRIERFDVGKVGADLLAQELSHSLAELFGLHLTGRGRILRLLRRGCVYDHA